ncbi:MAG: hypothetical protein Ct9H300mP22_3790 [Gammaproteobacteria bacterium]|nr:MAG: hypothetical protein Ct9H300mP22_3790 [Gammaproteobacteria bacterium]
MTSPAVLKKEQAEKFQVDVEACRAHWEQLQGDNEIKKKVSAVFSDESFPEETDPDLMIYSGAFFSDVDRDLMEILRATRPNDLGRLIFLSEMVDCKKCFSAIVLEIIRIL